MFSITPTFILFLPSEACLSSTALCENYYEEVMKMSSSHKEHNPALWCKLKVDITLVRD